MENDKKYSDLGNRLNLLEISVNIKATEFCRRLGIKDQYLTELKYGRIKKGGVEFWKGIRREFPEWEAYLRGQADEPPGTSDRGNTMDLSEEEARLIKAIREVDSFSRMGIYITAINQLNEAKREEEVKRDKKKQKIIDEAIVTLKKAVKGTGRV